MPANLPMKISGSYSSGLRRVFASKRGKARPKPSLALSIIQSPPGFHKIHVRLYALDRGAGWNLGCYASNNVSFELLLRGEDV